MLNLKLNVMKTKLLTFLILGISYFGYSQDSLQDSYTLKKSFTTFDFGVGTHWVDNRNINFGAYTVNTDKRYPTYNFGLFFTSTNLINDPKNIFNFKTGLLLNSNYADLTDSIGAQYQFSETNLSLPIMIGTRIPVNYNTSTDKFYKAVNLNIGGYISLPMFPNLHQKGEAYIPSEEFMSDYIKYGMIAEIIYTATNKEGKGHRFGLRTIFDFRSVTKLKDEIYGITPAYTTLSLFYVIQTY